MGRRRNKTVIVENVKIIGIADKGLAVGKDPEGQVYFVKGAVPGDVVNILRLKKRKGVYQGITREVVEESPHRIEPICKHFGQCGGCKWQNLQYDEQLKQKATVVRDAMRRIGKIDLDVSQIIGCSIQESYRNKIEYSFSTKRWLTTAEIQSEDAMIAQSPAVGFHAPGAFDKVVDVQTCHLQDNLTNTIRNTIREWAFEEGWEFYDARKHTGFLRNIFLRNNRMGEWMLTVCFREERDGQHFEVLRRLQKEFPQISSLYYIINQKPNDSIGDQTAIHFYGKEHLEESLDHVSFLIGPKSFFQTNTTQAEVLYQHISKLADLSGTEVVYDLYTGIGSIGLYLAKNAGKVVGIEEVPEAIDDAILNASKNNIDNCAFYAGDVKDILSPVFWKSHGRPDLLITDPPRAGMHKEVIQMLLQLGAPRVLYVSCNPATQARDLALLNEKYDVIALQPIDMFPHTHHIENIALLQLR